MNRIGEWEFDENRLPRYRYTGGYPVSAKDKAGNDAIMPEDPCFILGNYRITLLAHVGGSYELITGERGWARLNHGGKNRGVSRTVLCVDGKDGIVTEQKYGVGYASNTYEWPGEVTAARVLSVQPSREIHKGNSSVLITVTLKNHGADTVVVSGREELLANYRMINHQNEEPGSLKERIRYENRISTDCEKWNIPLTTPWRKAQTVKAEIHGQPMKMMAMPENPKQCFSHDCYPPTLFMHVAESDRYHSQAGSRREDFGDILFTQFEAELEPGEEITIQMVAGFTFETGDDAISLMIGDMIAQANIVEGAKGKRVEYKGREVKENGAYPHLWLKVLPKLEEEPDEIFRCEMLWNAYVLESMATYSQYFNETYIPQGSVYAYHLGQNASNRDHLQHSLPLIYTNPALAKSCIRYAMKHTMEDGEIRRQNIGYGYCDPGIYMESDPQLYLFMAVGEYLRITKDYGFLNERVTYYPAERGITDTVLNLLVRHFIYLRDVVGTGQHGMVRMLNSDWSDSFFHPYSPNIYANSAESHMNTAMALAVIPVLSEGITQYAAEEANREQVKRTAECLTGEMKEYCDALFTAFMKDMEGRTYAPRCYIGPHDELELKFGVNTLCLEPQPYLLQIKDFPVERKRQLCRDIKARVLDMEKIGARTREVPLWSAKGQGEDGGIWFSHQGPLIVGLASFDREEAVKLMKKLTFHHYADQYPEYWVGHWTFADSLESTLSDREGLYHFWTEGAFQPFCAHAHAWLLYCYYRVYKNI